MKLSEFILNTDRTILLDGAIGTQEAEAGLRMGCHNCIEHPDIVLDIQKRYVESGIDLLITNTLTMNRAYIEFHKLDIDVREVNLAGVELAKKALKPGQYVLGDISSTGKLLKPYGNISKEEAYDAFKEQAAILAEGNVDGLIIETLIDLEEALTALCACRDAADLPVIVCIAFNTLKNGGRTIMGNSAQECAEALTEAGAFAAGANCGSLDPFEMAEIISTMGKYTSLPLIAEPNAGKPRFIEGQTVFDMSPADFVTGLDKCIKAGAKLVGGCCGTTPAYIRAVADFLNN